MTVMGMGVQFPIAIIVYKMLIGLFS